ncbi:cyclase [Kitasatospora sp. NPDC088391]|uniref:terpene synthase family protein n=1 Tax=Kitasatospora sp. NPDC088391 TaxID=3364074 RepID=UPI0037FF4260
MSPAPHDGRLPGLHGPAAPEPDPAVVAAVDAAVAAWVEREDACPPAFRPELAGLGIGRAVALQYPDHAGPDHLLAAAALLVAEFVAWESCADDPDGSPADLAVRLLLAQSALDPADPPGPAGPPDLPEPADPVRRAHRAAMRCFGRIAGPRQAERLRHDVCRLQLGRLAEAAWRPDGRVPPVRTYLAVRRFNGFRPRLAVTDAVGGYELPAEVHNRPEVRRVVALGADAAALADDLYGYSKDLRTRHPQPSLPMVLAAAGRPEPAAYFEAVEVHNATARAFEAASDALRGTDPVLDRYLTGLAAWIAGHHRWQHTGTSRYDLPARPA